MDVIDSIDVNVIKKQGSSYLTKKKKMSDLNEQLYGKEFTAVKKTFDAEISELAAKYPDILEKDDTFAKHVFLRWNPQGIQFAVMDKDKITEYIQREMQEIFKKHFSPLEKN